MTMVETFLKEIQGLGIKVWVEALLVQRVPRFVDRRGEAIDGISRIDPGGYPGVAPCPGRKWMQRQVQTPCLPVIGESAGQRPRPVHLRVRVKFSQKGRRCLFSAGNAIS